MANVTVSEGERTSIGLTSVYARPGWCGLMRIRRIDIKRTYSVTWLLKRRRPYVPLMVFWQALLTWAWAWSLDWSFWELLWGSTFCWWIQNFSMVCKILEHKVSSSCQFNRLIKILSWNSKLGIDPPWYDSFTMFFPCLNPVYAI